MNGIYVTLLTTVHVAISLVGIAAGIVWLAGVLAGRWARGWNLVFLVTTIATSVTGFLFPFKGFTPAIGVGIISLAVLAVSVLALVRSRTGAGWRVVYLLSAMLALYLNVFVLVAQAFQKVPPLHALAPNGNEPAFLVAQTLTLAAFAIAALLVLVRRRQAVMATA